MEFYDICDLCEVQCGKIYITMKEGIKICTSCAANNQDLSSDIFSHVDNIKLKTDKECPVCLEVKHSIKLPNCNHYCCIDCFKKLYYGYTNLEKPKEIYPLEQDPYILMFPDVSDRMLNYEIQYKYEQYIDWSYHYTFATTKEDEEYMRYIRPGWMNTKEFIEWEYKKNAWEEKELKIDKERDLYFDDKNKRRNPLCPLCRK